MIHMTGIRAVVFDQDGTLIGTFIPAVHAYSAAVGRTITLEALRAVAHLDWHDRTHGRTTATSYQRSGPIDCAL